MRDALADANMVAEVVLGKSTWAVLALTCHIELFTLVHYKESIALGCDTDGGKRACLLERLGASVDSKRFRRPLASAFERWIGAVETLGRQAGLSKAVARERAEDLVVRIEGALIVCAGTGETKLFSPHDRRPPRIASVIRARG